MRKLFLCTLLLLAPALTGADDSATQPQPLPPLHHVVRVKVPDTMQVPEDFPLDEQGRILCRSCHGIEDIEDTPPDEVDRDADNFHRGGPYRKLSDFCYRCHEQKDYRRPNLHQVLDDTGRYDEKACEYCHIEAPDPEQVTDREALEFRLPPQKLCFGCHRQAPHLNALLHQVEADEKLRQRLQRAERELGVILPLDPDGRIMCATCHNPHQPGVIDRDSPAGRQVTDADLEQGIRYRDHPWDRVYRADKEERLARLAQQTGVRYTLGYRRLEQEVLLRLSARDGSLCLACHEFER